MSAQATFWAWEQCTTATQKLVLLALANCHNPDTGLCFPSYQYLADVTGLSRRGVIKAINELEQEGLLAKKQTRGSNHYTLHVSTSESVKPACSVASRNASASERGALDRHPAGERGAPPGEPGAPLVVNEVHPKLKEETKKEPKKETSELFDRFWAAYPRKVGKATALKAWSKLKQPGQVLELILANLEERANAGEWTDPRFIPHPSTYLNGERWSDQVLHIAAIEEEQCDDPLERILRAQRKGNSVLRQDGGDIRHAEIQGDGAQRAQAIGYDGGDF